MSVTLSRSTLAAPRAATRAATQAPVCFTEPGLIDLCIYRGDSGRLRVEVFDGNDVPFDVSGASWDCDIRANPDSSPALISLAVVPVSGQTNAVDLVLTAFDSALLDNDCVWDLEMTLGGEVTTLLAGRVQVTRDVSRSTA